MQREQKFQMINRKATRRETSRGGRKFNSQKGKKRTRKRNKKEKYHNEMVTMMILAVAVVVVDVIEVRIKGCNKVEFMAPKGSETRTSLTSFFYLT